MRKILVLSLFLLGIVAIDQNVLAKALNQKKDTYTGMEFVSVEGGCIQMGSSEGNDEEKPVHKVCVDGFWIGKYEVTQAQWQKVMDSTPSKFKGTDRPVENVSWRDAQEFINRINQKTGKLYRLPTEAEWEYAARGGNKSKGYTYSGANEAKEVAWFRENSDSTTMPIGKKQPNELGIFDMSGNVSEWCQDYFDDKYYRESPIQNPPGPAKGLFRVYRGGSWYDEAWYQRPTYRFRLAPDDLDSDLGFRLLLEPVKRSGVAKRKITKPNDGR